MGSEALALIAVLAFGAVGLFLVLPGAPRTVTRIGGLLLAAVGGLLIGLLAPTLVGGPAERGWFVAAALVALIGAVRVVTHRRPVYSALYFVMVIVAVAALLILASAEFLAISLVIIYAGAILVTYVFVIMLAQQAHPPAYDTQARDPLVGTLCGFVLVTVVTARLFTAQATPNPILEDPDAKIVAGTVESIGTQLLTQYVIGMQIAGILLLAAMVGAIAIARRKAGRAALSAGEE